MLRLKHPQSWPRKLPQIANTHSTNCIKIIHKYALLIKNFALGEGMALVEKDAKRSMQREENHQEEVGRELGLGEVALLKTKLALFSKF